MKVTLCGMMGCGKSTVAKALSQKLGLPLVDIDALIKEKYGDISSIFAVQGEAYFRDLETNCAKDLMEKDGLVIAVGGGFVLRKENVDCLKYRGVVVYLRASKACLLERLLGDTTRPLLQGEELSKRLDLLLEQRSSVYEDVCDFAVDVDEKTPTEIASEIVEKLRLMGACI